MSRRGSPPPQDTAAPSRFARRGFVLGGVALAAAGTVGALQWFNVGAAIAENALSVQDAHRGAMDNRITLIDIRRPDEWARTGVGEGAVPLDMRRDDFIDALLVEVAGARAAPVALICARGVRSARLSSQLTEAGFTQIIDVPEGMLGSGAGPGWLKAGLPVLPVD